MGQLVFQATLGGQVNLVGPNTASTFNLNVPAVAGTFVTTGDSGTVTNTMLATSAYTAPGTIGSGTANTGAFTTLSASSTVSGTGFSTYLASPPAIGGTAAAAGTFTTLSGTTSVTTPIVKSASSLTLQSNGTTTAVTIDTSQNVGIGTTSPVSATKLTINGSNDQIYLRTADTNAVAMSIGNAAGNSVYFQSKSTGTGTTLPFAWYMNSTQSMTLDTSGNLGIGTTSPGNPLHIYSNTVSQLRIQAVSGNTNANINLAPSGTGVAILGTLSGAFPLTFQTNSSEAGRFDTSGNLLVGTTTIGAGIKSKIYYATATAGNFIGSWYSDSGSTENLRASFRADGGLANYSGNNANLSDRREKTNFSPAGNYLEKICAIPIQTYNFIYQNLAEDSDLTLGAVAQDVQAVAPELVTESNWGTEEEPKMRLSIYQTDLQYALMKCIQELKAINDQQAETLTQQTEAINALTARVVALEAK